MRIGDRGFTLLEVLIVVALTGIIMGLVLGPLVQSFKLTRQAQVMVQAQDNARLALSQISRDLADAMYVYDNTSDPIHFKVRDANGNVVYVPVLYAKVDLVLPRMHGYCKSEDHPADISREYSRHAITDNSSLDEAAPTCPEDGSLLELRPVQPLTPDTLVVRYFIGLRDPNGVYANSYAERLTESREDDLFILYRVEFSPYDTNLFDGTDPSQNLRDPNFFYGPHSAEWKRISRPLVTLNDVDLVTFDRDTAGNVLYDADGKPKITPTVQFTPTAVYNDPLVPTVESRDDPEHHRAPPTVYKASYGHWVLPYTVTLEPDESDGGDYFFEAVPGRNLAGGSDPPDHMCIYRVDRDNSWSRTFVFNMSWYQDTATASPFGAGEVTPGPYANIGPRRAFAVNTLKGTVNFAFPHVDPRLSQSLGRSVSLAIPTEDVNVFYRDAGLPDRFRIWEFHHPNIRSLPYIGLTIPRDIILANSTVVPGTEQVFGPCMTPGPSYGELILYNRVPFLNPLAEPGVNQYKLDVGHLARDTNGEIVPKMEGTAAIYFHAVQAQTGTDEPLPDWMKIYMLYFEQNNKAGDRLRANYVTKSLITVKLGIRLYNPASGKPEVIQLTNKVRLRNIRT